MYSASACFFFLKKLSSSSLLAVGLRCERAPGPGVSKTQQRRGPAHRLLGSFTKQRFTKLWKSCINRMHNSQTTELRECKLLLVTLLSLALRSGRLYVSPDGGGFGPQICIITAHDTKRELNERKSTRTFANTNRASTFQRRHVVIGLESHKAPDKGSALARRRRSKEAHRHAKGEFECHDAQTPDVGRLRIALFRLLYHLWRLQQHESMKNQASPQGPRLWRTMNVGLQHQSIER